jgi:hypothetical protein
LPKVEIGIGAVIAAIAGLGWGSYAPVNVALLILGAVLVCQGTYTVYYRPNVRLDRTVKRWLERRYWRVSEDSDVPLDQFHFGFWVEDTGKRRVFVCREKEQRRILAFTAPVGLDVDTIDAIAKNFSTPDQQRLYEEVGLLLSTMHLGYISRDFRKITVQHGLPIDEELSEHSVDLKAKEVADGVIAVRCMIRKSVF